VCPRHLYCGQISEFILLNTEATSITISNQFRIEEDALETSSFPPSTCGVHRPSDLMSTFPLMSSVFAAGGRSAPQDSVQTFTLSGDLASLPTSINTVAEIGAGLCLYGNTDRV
jgi:hypothetical protein